MSIPRTTRLQEAKAYIVAPGFKDLTADFTDAPLGQDQLRAIFPLSDTGDVKLKMYSTEVVKLSWRFVALSECGEVSTDVESREISMRAGAPSVVIYDRFDYRRPKKITHSLDGQYELIDYGSSYQVINRGSGAVLVEREGRCPRFSPTARFVTALVGEVGARCDFHSSKRDQALEVLDLIAREMVARVQSEVLWGYQDTYLILPPSYNSDTWDGFYSGGEVISLLIDTDQPHTSKTFQLFPADPRFGGLNDFYLDVRRGNAYELFPMRAPSVFNLALSDYQDSAFTQEEGNHKVLAQLPERLRARGIYHYQADPNIVTIHEPIRDDDSEEVSPHFVKHKEIALGDQGRLSYIPDYITRGAFERSRQAVRVSTSRRQQGNFERAFESITGVALERGDDQPKLMLSDHMSADQYIRRSVYRPAKAPPKLSTLSEFERGQLISRADWVSKRDQVLTHLLSEVPELEPLLQLVMGIDAYAQPVRLYRNALRQAWRRQTGDQITWLTYAPLTAQAGQGVGSFTILSRLDLTIKRGRQLDHYQLLGPADEEVTFSEYLYSDDGRATPPLYYDLTQYSEASRRLSELIEQEGVGLTYNEVKDPGNSIIALKQRYPKLSFAKKLRAQDRYMLRLRTRSGEDQSLDSAREEIAMNELSAVFLGDRSLLIPIAQRGYLIDLEARTMCTISFQSDLSKSTFYHAQSGPYVVTLHPSGQVTVLDTKRCRGLLQGRWIDDELVIYDEHNRFVTTAEGARYVRLEFPGVSRSYPLYLFKRQLRRPELIRATLQSGEVTPRESELSPPPQVNVSELTFNGDHEQGRARFDIEIKSARPLDQLLIYRDGVLRRVLKLKGQRYSQPLQVTLAPESRWVSVVALNQDGVQSSPITVRVPVKASPQPAQGRLWTISVGTDQYGDPQVSELMFATRDAQTFLKAARQSKGQYYREVKERALIDSPKLRERLPRVIREVVSAAGSEDTIMLQIAGHGYQSASGRLYLLGRESRLEHLSETALDWEELGELFSSARARVVIFLDVCHAGATDRGASHDSVTSLLTQDRAPITVIASSKGRQESQERTALGGGVFTSAIYHALVRNRAQTDLNHNGVIELSELYDVVKRSVVHETKGAQTPWLARDQLVGEAPLF